MDCILNIAGIARDSIVDGPGIRFTVFCQGCPHACPGCHNPQTHEFGGGTPFTPYELFIQVKKNPLVRGVTLSGGEPFSQPDGCAEFAELCHDEGYEVAIFTGYLFEALLTNGSTAQKKLLALTDVLIDGAFLIEQRNISLKYRGSENQRIINVSQSLDSGKATLETSARWN